MRLIDADALKRKFRNVNEGMFQLSRVYELIDNAPTIGTSYDLYREETCERKAHCYDYKYWHCIGCHGCKVDMREEKDND